MKTLYFSIIILFAINVKAQIGIGTAAPANAALLDISATNKGVLIPRVALSSTTLKTPLTGNIPNGTMIFNTASLDSGITSVIPGIYVWDTNQWKFPAEIGIDRQKAVKFQNNSGNTVNFNPAIKATRVNITVFGETPVFNDDPAIFTRLNNTDLQLNQSGLYLVSANLALRDINQKENTRIADYIYFTLDNTLASAKIITLVPQYNPNKVNVNGRFAYSNNAYINVVAGQILRLNSERYKDGVVYDGTINFDSESLSSVTVIKIN